MFEDESYTHGLEVGKERIPSVAFPPTLLSTLQLHNVDASLSSCPCNNSWQSVRAPRVVV